jgi:hypothetical protein
MISVRPDNSARLRRQMARRTHHVYAATCFGQSYRKTGSQRPAASGTQQNFGGSGRNSVMEYSYWISVNLPLGSLDLQHENRQLPTSLF